MKGRPNHTGTDWSDKASVRKYHREALAEWREKHSKRKYWRVESRNNFGVWICPEFWILARKVRNEKTK